MYSKDLCCKSIVKKQNNYIALLVYMENGNLANTEI